MIPPGTLIDKYRVAHLLGDGGMGAVYAAEHVVLGRRAAIKVLHPHIASNPDIVRRFIAEAMGAAKLEHRNVVRVLDCGQMPENGQWFIALEFLDGESLGAYMHRRGGPIELPTILHVLAEASNGLHAAHEANFVHRDVKPDNFFITRTADDPMRVIVLDFGIAKLNQSHSGADTRSGVVMGTPAYMSPEQLRDTKDVDRRADIFALGVIAYEMATGTRPWGATTSLYDIIAQHSRLTAPPDPRVMRSDLPPEWATVVARAMEPDVNRRWPSAKDFAWALAEATPMPYSRDGRSVVETFARELVKSGSNSLTVGRPLPPELASGARVEVPTAPLRVSAPPSVSDGVPRSGGASQPGTAVMSGSDLGAPHAPISTLAASSGQSVAPATAPASKRSTVPFVVAGLGVMVGVVIAVVAVTSGGGDAASQVGAPKADATTPAIAPLDAAPSVPRATDASPPPDASTPDAGVAIDASPAAPDARPGRRRDAGPRGGKDPGSGEKAGTGTGSGFNSDDVLD